MLVASLPLIRPPALRPDDLVRVLSPSWCGAGLYPHRLERGCTALKSLGLRVDLGAHALAVTGHVAGTANQRAADLNAAFAQPEVRAIFCAIGGDHSNQLLNLLDFDLIRENPKPLVGFSDITVLQLALLARSGLTSFYGPTVLTGLAEFPQPLPYTLDHLRRALFTTTPLGLIEPSASWTDEYLDWGEKADLIRPRSLSLNRGPRALKEGVAVGQLMGGCLPSLMHLRGTHYWPDFEGALLFWEIPEGRYGPAEVDSHLADLELVGVFARIRGMLVGRPYQYTDAMRAELDAVILERTSGFGFPILIDLDFGHTDPISTMPVGARAELDTGRLLLNILEPGCA